MSDTKSARGPRPASGPPEPPVPTQPALVILRREERVNGWYEARAPQGILHQRVRATLIGFRTYVFDGKIVTDAMVLPQERNTSYGFIPVPNFVVSDATVIERGGPVAEPENLNTPY